MIDSPTVVVRIGASAKSAHGIIIPKLSCSDESAIVARLDEGNGMSEMGGYASRMSMIALALAQMPCASWVLNLMIQ